MKIQEIMHQGIETTTPDSTIKEAARKMHDLHIGALPVLEGDALAGMITDRDICVKVVATGRDAVMTQVKEIMTKEVATCFDDQDVEDAAKVMQEKHIHRMAILSRDNTLSGFLSVDDLAKSSFNLAGDVLATTATIH